MKLYLVIEEEEWFVEITSFKSMQELKVRDAKRKEKGYESK